MLRIVGELLHPIARLRRMHPKVLRCLHIGYPSILDQAHRLKLEFPRKLPSLMTLLRLPYMGGLS